MRERTWIEIVVGVVALVVSGISLWVGVRTEDANEELVASSTWPFVQDIETIATKGASREVSLAISNSGVGPAKVESFELFWRGKPMATPAAFLAACCGYDPKSALHYSHSTSAPTVLRVGQAQTVLAMEDTEETHAVFTTLAAVLPSVTFSTCYCSVLDRCWISDLASLDPEPVKTCPVPKHPFHS
jgi:hypothetical protein